MPRRVESAEEYYDRLRDEAEAHDRELEMFNSAAEQASLAQGEVAEAHGYLSRVFAVCAPQCEPLPDLMGLCTQIDNLITSYRIRLGEMPDPIAS